MIYNFSSKWSWGGKGGKYETREVKTQFLFYLRVLAGQTITRSVAVGTFYSLVRRHFTRAQHPAHSPTTTRDGAGSETETGGDGEFQRPLHTHIQIIQQAPGDGGNEVRALARLYPSTGQIYMHYSRRPRLKMLSSRKVVFGRANMAAVWCLVRDNMVAASPLAPSSASDYWRFLTS